jgi:hypothetical protein
LKRLETAIGTVAIAATLEAAIALAVGPWVLALDLIPRPGAFAALTLADDAAISVAGATLVLAIFTAVSVFEGHRERLVSERALEASWRPILVDVPLGLFVSSGTFMSFDRGRVQLTRVGTPLVKLRPMVPLRNVGSGPAIILGGSLSIGSHRSVAPAEISAPIVPPDTSELVTIGFEILADRADLGTLVDDLQKETADRPPWLVVVAYTDQAGSNQWRTEVHVHPIDANGWYVRQVALVDGKTDRTVVMSGPKTE